MGGGGLALAGGDVELPRPADGFHHPGLDPRRYPEHRQRSGLRHAHRGVHVGVRVPEPHRRFRGGPVQPPLDGHRQPRRLVGGDVGDGTRDDLLADALLSRAHGHQRGVLHPGGAGADRGLSFRRHAGPGGGHSSKRHLCRSRAWRHRRIHRANQFVAKLLHLVRRGRRDLLGGADAGLARRAGEPPARRGRKKVPSPSARRCARCGRSRRSGFSSFISRSRPLPAG